MDGGHNADIFRQADDGFAHATVNAGFEVLSAFAGEVYGGLAGANIEFEAR